MFKRISFLITALFFLFVTTNAFAGVIELPQTGQTKCYDTNGVEIPCAGTGQDGDIRAGVAWPNPRFTPGTGAQSDCITDNLTGLMWPRNGNLAGYMTWYSAVDYANNLTLCGYSDWRLPNVNELESLVTADVSNTAAWLNTQGFTNVQSVLYYWSSTTGAGYMNFAWNVDMWDGSVFDFGKVSNGFVWPVRSGQSGSFDYYCDDDGDGYIDSSISGTCTGNGCVPSGCQTTAGDDCDDNDPLVNPGATEVCDGIDNNCDGQIDEGDVCGIPDLFISTLSAPSSASAGQVISISDTTNNQGTGSAGASTTKFYLSTDATYNRGDTSLGRRGVIALATGASSSGRTRVTIPAGTAAGTYYIIAVADADRVIVEGNERNNSRAKSITITSP